MANNFAAVIFDMDGLLVDSETIWYKAEDQFIQSFGHVYTEMAREAIVGRRMDEFMGILKDYYSLPGTVESLCKNLEDRLLRLIPQEVKAQPGAAEVIAYVVDRAIPHAIASSSSTVIINATLESQGWSGHFALRCSADDDANGKPAPDVYLRAANNLGVDPAACVALEDSPNGARAATAAGMTCYAVPDLFHSSPDAFADITPHVFTSLHEVLESLKA